MGIIHIPVGNGSDGVLSTTGNVSLTSTTDGDAVVKQYTSLTVNSGHTLTVSNRCKGLHLYVSGNLTLNGTISMTARGASASNANQKVNTKRYAGGVFNLMEYQIWKPLLSPDFTKEIEISTSVANGGAENNYRAPANCVQDSCRGHAGNNGNNGGSLFQCGGGGSGGVYSYWFSGDYGIRAIAGRGGHSTFYSGGAGSGASWHGTGTEGSNIGSDSGGSGSAGYGVNGSLYAEGGGAGNPGGSGGDTGTAGGTGTGGQIIIFVGGLFTGIGTVSSNGSSGGAGSTTYNIGGGGSGGGSITIIARYPHFSGTFSANGGSGGGSNVYGPGGNGGNGYIYINTIDDFWNTYG